MTRQPIYDLPTCLWHVYDPSTRLWHIYDALMTFFITLAKRVDTLTRRVDTPTRRVDTATWIAKPTHNYIENVVDAGGEDVDEDHVLVYLGYYDWGRVMLFAFVSQSPFVHH
jgi:hypothetical protein